MTSIHKIPTNRLEVGMFVSDTTPGMDQTGLNRRGLISRPETLATLQASGIAEIYIDISKGKTSSYARPVALKEVDTEPTVDFEEERQKALAIYGEARSLVGNMINNVKLGKAIDVGPIEELGHEISNSVLANSNALLCLSQIREKDQYLMEHSINVGILLGVFARYLGYEGDDLHQLVTGGLMHDIGKIRVPDRILHKAGKLDADEWQEMQNHVLYGEETLIKSQGISDIALSICAQHHEKLNGKGYPRGLEGDAISTAGRISSIVDIYDAITADRCYHNGKSPNETMKILARLGREDLDKELVYQFIRCMSVYPVGTMVELSDKGLGVVTQIHNKRPDSPTVSLFYDIGQRSYIKPKVIDLSDPSCSLTVVRAHDPNVLNMKVKNFI